MQRFLPFLLATLMLVVAFAVTSSGSQPTVVNAEYWCPPDPGVDDDGDCVLNPVDSCPNTPEADVPGNKTSYTFGYGYPGNANPDPGGTDSYGCSLAQIQDADLDHHCDNADFNAVTDYNDRCWVPDACPGTALADVANSYEWGTGYPGNPNPDNGGKDSYGCALAQIQDSDLDHFCDNVDWVENDRCWLADSCPGAAEDFVGAEDGCPEVVTTLQLKKILVPSTDTAEFDLKIEDVIVFEDLGHEEVSLPYGVQPGLHTVSELASDGNPVTGYLTLIDCLAESGAGAVVASGQGASLQVDVAAGDEILCVFTNIAVGAFEACSGPYDKVFIGDDNANTITGTPGNDLIIGLGGADTLNGGLGNDCIVGGDGADIINGGSGNDIIYGGADADNILGSNGHDTIYGGDGADVIDGGNDNDMIYGDGGSDTIRTGNSSGSGRNYAYGGEDDDTLIGGTGRDTLLGNGGTDSANGGTGFQDACNAETKKLCELFVADIP